MVDPAVLLNMCDWSTFSTAPANKFTEMHSDNISEDIYDTTYA